jgi:ribosomal protein S14
MPHLNGSYEDHTFNFENNDHKSKSNHPSSLRATKLTKTAKKVKGKDPCSRTWVHKGFIQQEIVKICFSFPPESTNRMDVNTQSN